MKSIVANSVCRPLSRSRRNQDGYAILLVLFFVTLMLLATISIAPNVLTEGRREKEKEMIWRGKQYARGVKMYYRKTGKFPTSMDDLIKPKLGSLRFMRQAYKDPMNAKDGDWRLIYVGPTGQLIGSLKPPQTIQMSGVGGALGAVPGTPAAQLGAQSGGQGFGQGFGQGLGQAVGQVFGNGASNNSASTANGPGQQTMPAQPNSNGQPNNTTNAGGNPAAGTDATSMGVTAADSSGTPTTAGDAANEALLASDSATVIGGNIIGVGSKINHSSILVYEKAKNYKQFEFIWDPAKDTITVGGAAGPQIGTPAGQPGQSTPFGTSPTSNPGTQFGPGQPPPGPPETTPTPPPSQP